MALDLAKIKALQAQVKETGKDLTKPTAGGGDYEPPKEGPTRLRLVSYVETGIHSTVFKGATKTKPRAELVFELSGPLHPPKVNAETGEKYPHKVTVREAVGYTAKNGYMKLFNLLKADYPEVTSFVELLGKAFRGEISHYKFKRTDQTEGVIAQLKDDSGYHISGLTYNDPETGEPRKLKVDAPITPLTAFLWDYADTDQWDSIFVDGTYDDGGSKNKLQDKIRSAENFSGSPIYEALIEAGRDAEIEATVQEAPAKAPESPQEAPKSEVEATPAPAKKTAPKPAAKPKGKPAPEPAADEDDGDPLAGV